MHLPGFACVPCTVIAPRVDFRFLGRQLAVHCALRCPSGERAVSVGVRAHTRVAGAEPS